MFRWVLSVEIGYLLLGRPLNTQFCCFDLVLPPVACYGLSLLAFAVLFALLVPVF
jgi:hypothetical protein